MYNHASPDFQTPGFELIQTVASQQLAVLLISHNLPQVYEICHRVVVLFRGEVVADLRPSEVDIDDIVGWITGSAVAAFSAW